MDYKSEILSWSLQEFLMSCYAKALLSVCNMLALHIRIWSGIIPALSDLSHRTISWFLFPFSERAVLSKAASRPSACPRRSKRDEAAARHVYASLSAWRGVRHTASSNLLRPSGSSQHVLSLRAPIASSPILFSTVLRPEIWFLIKSAVNGCSSCNKNEPSYTLGFAASRGN